jgi:hypothetical protein
MVNMDNAKPLGLHSLHLADPLLHAHFLLAYDVVGNMTVLV